MFLAMKDESRSILKDEENDFFLDNSYGEETMEELTTAVMLMARIQLVNGNSETVPSYDTKAIIEVNASSKLHEQKPSSHDQIVYKMGQLIPIVHMLGNKPNKVYETFQKAGLGYQNLERLKKAIVAQPKMYDGERLHSAKLTIDSPDSKEMLEDAEES
nr:hypothetical protein [Tanacetum cinerariifolium]